MKNLLNTLYHKKLVESLMHTVVYELKEELKDCKSVLDLGCGPNSPIQYCKNIDFKVGVEAYKDYLTQSKNRNIHNKYICEKIEELKIEPKSFDAVILVEVLEHLPKEVGLEILKKAEIWARKKIIVTTPNGYIKQRSLDGNELQKHLAGWDANDFEEMGYKVNGLAGLKILRKEAEHESMDDSIMSTIRWAPKPLWFGVSALSQLFCYYLPNLAFELVAVKKINQ